MIDLSYIHDFAKDVFIKDIINTTELIGIRGELLMDLSRLGLPITPGFIINSSLVKQIREGYSIKELLIYKIAFIESCFPRKYANNNNPLLLKVVQSPDVHFLNTTSIHQVGLNDKSVIGFSKATNQIFAYEEYRDFFKQIGVLLLGIPEEEFRKMAGNIYQSQKIEDIKSTIDLYQGLVEQHLPQDPLEQLEFVINKSVKLFYANEENKDINLAIVVQAMVYGNYGEDSYAGSYFTRNIISGEKKLDGKYFQKEFHTDRGDGEDIERLNQSYLEELKKIADTIESSFKEIREIKFAIESKKLWLVDQKRCDKKSTQAELKTLLNLRKSGIISDEYVVQAIPPSQINELLHPMINPSASPTSSAIKGGIAGAPGAAIGRVFFSTESLIKEYRQAIRLGEDHRLILCMNATYAEDVKAIELSEGVISTEGGFSSHAPVVSRSLGKVALVNPKINIQGNSFILDKKKVKEGDWISLDVSYYSKPVIYFDKLPLLTPDVKQNGLIELLEIANQFINGMDVKANADLKRDAMIAHQFKAVGIGLCRTEHMFFHEDRINLFRKMIISTTYEERIASLNTLLPFQENDFYDLFKVMEGYPVTIRLLDAPLHEFLPHTKDSMSHFVQFIQKENPQLSEEEIRYRCDDLSEVNPMLGHRGCRVAISYPEIYRVQITAIFRACARLIKEQGLKVEPEIMIPMVIDKKEFRIIKNGKKMEGKEIQGIHDICKEICEEFGIDEIPYRVGTMIELPGSALQASELARYAQFFSFGTNDLTQTTCGLSRDDINSFLSDYTEYDIFSDNPFRVLTDEVKELIQIATTRGRMTRPDIIMGMCGEHAGEPKNIAFCKEIGLQYISCSPYSIPIAKLTIAQLNLKK